MGRFVCLAKEPKLTTKDIKTLREWQLQEKSPILYHIPKNILGSHSTCANREVNTCWKYEYTPIPGFPNSGPGVIVWSLGSLFASPSVCEAEDCHDKKGWSLSKQQCLNFPNFLLISILSHYFLQTSQFLSLFLLTQKTNKTHQHTKTHQNASILTATEPLCRALTKTGTRHAALHLWCVEASCWRCCQAPIHSTLDSSTSKVG